MRPADVAVQPARLLIGDSDDKIIQSLDRMHRADVRFAGVQDSDRARPRFVPEATDADKPGARKHYGE